MPRRSKKSTEGKQSYLFGTPGQDQRAERAEGQLVPEEPEAVLARGAEQVDGEALADVDAAEVHGHGGGRLGLHAGERVHRATGLAQPLLGAQRADLADRPDQGGLARAETARDQDLQRHYRVHRRDPSGPLSPLTAG
jgi:hypothetical protein